MRKYKQGEKIRSLGELEKEELVFMGSKILHKGWFKNWRIQFALSLISRELLFKAIKIEKEE